MDGLPDEILSKLKGFNDAMTDFENTLDEFNTIPYAEQTQRPALERARLDMTSLFTLNSLYWSYLSCAGKQPKDNEDLSIELKRAKEYMTRLKKFDEHHLRPQVNQRGAKAFVRNALFDVNADEPSPMQEKANDNEDWEKSATEKEAVPAKKAKFSSGK